MCATIDMWHGRDGVFFLGPLLPRYVLRGNIIFYGTQPLIACIMATGNTAVLCKIMVTKYLILWCNIDYQKCINRVLDKACMKTLTIGN